MSDDAVSVRFGGDVTGLDTAARVAKAQLNAFNAEVRKLAKEAATSGGAINDNLSKALREAAAGAARMQNELKSLTAPMQEELKSLTAPTKEVVDGFKNMTESVANNAYELGPWTGQHVEMAKNAILGLHGALGAAGIAFAAVGAAAAVAMAGIGAAAIHMGENAQRMGSQFELSGQGVARLGSVAAKSGIELKDLASALQNISKKAGEGDKDIEAAAKALGVSADQLKTKDLPGLLRVLQAAYDKNGDSANRYAAMQKLLGEIFEKVYPVMQEGVGVLDGLYAAADRSRSAIGDQLKDALAGTISASREAGAAWDEFKKSVEGAVLALYEHFKPAIDGAIMGFGNLVRNIASAVQGFTEASREASVTSLALDVIGEAARGVITAIALLTTAFETLLTTASAVLKEIGDLVRGVGNLFKELWKDISGGDGNMSGAWSKMTGDMTHDAVDWGKNLRTIAKQTKDELGAIWGEGVKGKAPASNLRATGNPEPDKDEKSKKAKAPKGNSDGLNEARKEIDGEIQAVQQQTQINIAQYELDAARKKITEEEKKNLVQQATDQELAAIESLYAREKQLSGQKPAQIQGINNKIEALESQHQVKMLQLQAKELQDAARAIDQQASHMASTLTSSISQAIEGMVEHTNTKGSGKKLAQSLFNSLVDDLVKNTLTKPLETALQPMFQGLSSAISQPLMQGFQTAVNSMMSMIQPLLSSLASAFSGLFSGLAGAAGGAAAGGGGGIGSLFGGIAATIGLMDIGAWEIPHDQLAFVHKGEMVATAAQAEGLRNMAENGGARGGGGTTTHVNASPTFNISTMDSRSFARYINSNDRTIAKSISRLVKNGAHLGL
jgi:hypothetical protein